MCMGIFPEYMSMYQMCSWCSWRPEEGVRYPTRVTNSICLTQILPNVIPQQLSKLLSAVYNRSPRATSLLALFQSVSVWYMGSGISVVFSSVSPYGSSIFNEFSIGS